MLNSAPSMSIQSNIPIAIPNKRCRSVDKKKKSKDISKSDAKKELVYQKQKEEEEEKMEISSEEEEDYMELESSLSKKRAEISIPSSSSSPSVPKSDTNLMREIIKKQNANGSFSWDAFVISFFL